MPEAIFIKVGPDSELIDVGAQDPITGQTYIHVLVKKLSSNPEDEQARREIRFILIQCNQGDEDLYKVLEAFRIQDNNQKTPFNLVIDALNISLFYKICRAFSAHYMSSDAFVLYKKDEDCLHVFLSFHPDLVSQILAMTPIDSRNKFLINDLSFLGYCLQSFKDKPRGLVAFLGEGSEKSTLRVLYEAYPDRRLTYLIFSEAVELLDDRGVFELCAIKDEQGLVPVLSTLIGDYSGRNQPWMEKILPGLEAHNGNIQAIVEIFQCKRVPFLEAIASSDKSYFREKSRIDRLFDLFKGQEGLLVQCISCLMLYSSLKRERDFCERPRIDRIHSADYLIDRILSLLEQPEHNLKYREIVLDMHVLDEIQRVASDRFVRVFLHLETLTKTAPWLCSGVDFGFDKLKTFITQYKQYTPREIKEKFTDKGVTQEQIKQCIEFLWEKIEDFEKIDIRDKHPHLYIFIQYNLLALPRPPSPVLLSLAETTSAPACSSVASASEAERVTEKASRCSIS